MLSSGLNQRPKILVFLGRYLPGFNSGGPVRTISCMVEALAPHFDFYIVTLNRDSGSREVYKNVRTDEWNTVGAARVFYTPRFSMRKMQRIADEIKPDALYFNGFFSTSSILGILKRRLGGFEGIPAIVATRGDLAAGALGLKSSKKRLYIESAKTLGLYRDLLWHASSEREKREMLAELREFGVHPDQIHVAPDLSSFQAVPYVHRNKVPGVASFVTVGRITRMKNLPFTLERLKQLSGRVTLDVFGPLEDRDLWTECEAAIETLPSNIAVRYQGVLEPSQVIGELATRHFFILPTLGENYGHVIVEGMAAGCPVVISDRTQWQSLAEKQVGWDIPLEMTGEWNAVLQTCVDMPQERYTAMSTGAAEFGRAMMESVENLTANIELFRRAVSRGKAPVQADVAGVSK